MGCVERILSYYMSENAGILKNIRHILMHGRLGGTGKLLILPIDQGFEHGPGHAFSKHPHAFNPMYHFQLAVHLGLSAYAAPIGALNLGACAYAGHIPLILKLNSNNKLVSNTHAPYPAWTASVEDALRLGCSAVGITIYPGSDASTELFTEVQEVIAQAREYGLPSIVWAYPRGGDLSEEDSTALDVVGYSTHIAALLGAHFIKVKLPTALIACEQEAYQDIPKSTKADRVRHIMQCAFQGQRIVLFSGGQAKDDDTIYDDVQAIAQGGGHGSMMARNLFQRTEQQAHELSNRIVNVYTQSTCCT